jgi:hypothetical protein
MVGKVEINDTGESTTILLDGDNATATLGGSGETGRLVLASAAGTAVIEAVASPGTLSVAADGSGGGAIKAQDASGNDRILLDGPTGDIKVLDAGGDSLLHFASASAALYVGGAGNEGDRRRRHPHQGHRRQHAVPAQLVERRSLRRWHRQRGRCGRARRGGERAHSPERRRRRPAHQGRQR